MDGRGMNDRRGRRLEKYAQIRGMIVEMVPMRMGGRVDGCTVQVSVEDENGNMVNFVMNPATYVVDGVTLTVGMSCSFWHRMDVPAPLIYPPQYRAVVIAQNRNDRNVDVSYYDEALVNQSRTLQLHVDRSVRLRTTNQQQFLASPGEHDLVVEYTSSTRSIPAQTTPEKIVVLCGE